MKWRWEAREKHWGDYRKVVTELGFLDSHGRQRKWDGPKFWPRFGVEGHDSADFDACKCGRGLSEQPMGYA